MLSRRDKSQPLHIPPPYCPESRLVRAKSMLGMYLDLQHARNQAAKLDAHGDLKSLPLAGAAVGVKDIIDTADMPTENGTVLEAGRAISAVDYAGALRERERHYRQLEALVAPYDAILTPSSTGRRRAD